MKPEVSNVYRKKLVVYIFDPGWGRTFYSFKSSYKHLTSPRSGIMIENK